MKRLAAALALLGGWQWYAAHRWGAEQVQGRMYVATAFVALVFMALYSRDPWWRNWFGRSLMLLAFSMFVLGVSVVLFRFVGPDYFGRPVVIVFVADSVFLAMCMRTVVLWNAQRRDRRDKELKP